VTLAGRACASSGWGVSRSYIFVRLKPAVGHFHFPVLLIVTGEWEIFVALTCVYCSNHWAQSYVVTGIISRVLLSRSDALFNGFRCKWSWRNSDLLCIGLYVAFWPGDISL